MDAGGAAGGGALVLARGADDSEHFFLVLLRFLVGCGKSRARSLSSGVPIRCGAMTVGGRLIPAGLDGFELPTLTMWFVGNDLGRPLLNIVDRVADRAVGNENIVIGRDPEPASEPWGSLGRRCFRDVVVEVDIVWDAGAAEFDALDRDPERVGVAGEEGGGGGGSSPGYPNSGTKYRRMLPAPLSPTGPIQHM